MIQSEVDVRIIMTGIKATDLENTMFEITPRGLSGASPETVQGLDRLRKALEAHATAAGREARTGEPSVLRTWIHCDPTAPWHPVMSVMLTLAQVRAPDFGFLFTEGKARRRIALRLPTDSGLTPAAAAQPRAISITLFESETTWRFTVDRRKDPRVERKNEQIEVPVGDVAAVRRYLEAALGPQGRVRITEGAPVQISMPPPGGPYVQMAFVVACTEALQALGATDIRFEGRPSTGPAPKRR